MPAPPPVYTGGDLRRFRQSRGWTLADLAAWAGYHKGTLSRMERGLVPVPYQLRRMMELAGFQARSKT